MTSRQSPDHSDSRHMDELIARQDEVIQELEKLDERLVQTIEDFRASIAKEEPSQQSDSTIESTGDSTSNSVSVPKAA